ncbi:alpha/beta fold hydrolase [Virgibacillus siamensis]|uniref:alpha/beta fold hydrolase n=1 Tax=Virgibacillus siamensis TaxID=480071 RepID=UPI0009846658|nr:alpha/beta hydrolase [Virgibacillus siamensis]
MQQVHKWGNRENPALVLLHGMGGTGLSFGELAHYLSDYYVVSLDLSAGEYSGDEAYMPSNMAETIHRLINQLDLQGITLVGHSWGAHLALYYAAAHPEKITRVISLDGGYIEERGSLDEELQNLVEFHNSIRFPSWEAFWESERSELPRWSEELEAASRSQVKEIDGEIRLALPIPVAQAIVKGIFNEPTSEILDRVSSPVLLLRSDLPEELEELRTRSIHHFRKHVPDAAVHVIPGTTHDIYRDAPEKVAEQIKLWIPNE